MIKNEPTISNSRTDLQRSCIEHRAIWFALLFDEARKQGVDASFAHEAIKRCGVFQGMNNFVRTDDLEEFANNFASEDIKNTFEMEILEQNAKEFFFDFHYCPLVKAWQKLGIPEDQMEELCDIAMEGDRGIISTYPEFEFELGDTIANGDDVCQIRIRKK